MTNEELEQLMRQFDIDPANREITRRYVLSGFPDLEAVEWETAKDRILDISQAAVEAKKKTSESYSYSKVVRGMGDEFDFDKAVSEGQIPSKLKGNTAKEIAESIAKNIRR